MVVAHGEEKIFECNICSKTFGTKRELMLHIENIHQGEDPYIVTNLDCYKFRLQIGRDYCMKILLKIS